ncbi:MAG: hypothetical protein RLP44_07275 [Aggregatilineales bacterium]
MGSLGTITWAERTQGTLSIGDKLTMIRQEVQRQLVIQWKRVTGKGVMQVERVDLETIVIPDSSLAVASLKVCESLAPPSLFFS